MGKSQSDENLLALFRQKLREESQRWTEENLLSPEQRDTILQRYETPPTLSAETESVKEFPLFIRVVLALAVVLVGMAVLLLVSFNWQHLDGASKLTIVGAVLAVAHGGGFWLRKTSWKNWADGTFFFAGIMYGVGIWQIGQVFHLPADFPMGMWLWAFGAFLLALILASTPLHLLSVALLVVWVIAAWDGFFELHRLFFFGLVPFSALSLPLIAAVGIGASILNEKRFAATLYVFLLVFWGIMQGSCCGLGPHLTFHIVLTGLICIVIASWQFKSISNTALQRVGVMLIAGGLIAPSFLDYWGWLLTEHVWNHQRIADDYLVHLFWVFALPAINFLILFGLIRLRDRKASLAEFARSHQTVIALATAILVIWIGSYAISLLMNPGGRSYHYYSHHHRAELLNNPLVVVGMFAVNVLIVWQTIGLIVGGLRRNRNDWFWSGVLFFLLWAIVRYVDLFSAVGGMLGASVIFMFCGLFMFGIVYVWTTRRHRFRFIEPVTISPTEFTVPTWLATMGDKLSRFWQSEQNIMTGIVIVALVQFGILGAMMVNEMRPHVSGTTIRVTTVPIDPRDMFRGDYVILRYEFCNASRIPWVGQQPSMVHNKSEQTVYVTMKQEGELWKAVNFSLEKPKEAVFLRGVMKPYGAETVFGIESYFVQEGTGKAIEDAMRRNREGVIVELVVAPDGKASIKTVHVQ